MEPGSFRLVYADTDSIAIATTGTGHLDGSREDRMRSIYDPMLKPENRQSFYVHWKKWFVLSDRIEDLRKPGLLKRKFPEGVAPKNML